MKKLNDERKQQQNGKNLRYNPYNPSRGSGTVQYLRWRWNISTISPQTEYRGVCVLSSKNSTIGLHLRNTKEPTNNH